MCLTKIDAQILNFLTMLHYIIHLIYIIIQLYWGFYIIIQRPITHQVFRSCYLLSLDYLSLQQL
jgi:hypothetical protein